jgi:hypothetical protein
MRVKNALFLVKNTLQSIKILHTEDAKKALQIGRIPKYRALYIGAD